MDPIPNEPRLFRNLIFNFYDCNIGRLDGGDKDINLGDVVLVACRLWVLRYRVHLICSGVEPLEDEIVWDIIVCLLSVIVGSVGYSFDFLSSSVDINDEDLSYSDKIQSSIEILEEDLSQSLSDDVMEEVYKYIFMKIDPRLYADIIRSSEISLKRFELLLSDVKSDVQVYKLQNYIFNEIYPLDYYDKDEYNKTSAYPLIKAFRETREKVKNWLLLGPIKNTTKYSMAKEILINARDRTSMSDSYYINNYLGTGVKFNNIESYFHIKFSMNRSSDTRKSLVFKNGSREVKLFEMQYILLDIIQWRMISLVEEAYRILGGNI